MINLPKENVKNLIIHHTGTNRNRTTYNAIRNYHVNNLKWPACGYHYVITADGIIHKGRDEKYVGSHAKTTGLSMNFRSLGIALTGNFEIEKPTTEQIKSLVELLISLQDKYNIPDNNILGHSEIKATLCPGKSLLEHIKDYRDEQLKPDEPELPKGLKEWISGIKQLVSKLSTEINKPEFQI